MNLVDGEVDVGEQEGLEPLYELIHYHGWEMDVKRSIILPAQKTGLRLLLASCVNKQREGLKM